MRQKSGGRRVWDAMASLTGRQGQFGGWDVGIKGSMSAMLHEGHHLK